MYALAVAWNQHRTLICSDCSPWIVSGRVNGLYIGSHMQDLAIRHKLRDLMVAIYRRIEKELSYLINDVNRYNGDFVMISACSADRLISERFAFVCHVIFVNEAF